MVNGETCNYIAVAHQQALGPLDQLSPPSKGGSKGSKGPKPRTVYSAISDQAGDQDKGSAYMVHWALTAIHTGNSVDQWSLVPACQEVVLVDDHDPEEELLLLALNAMATHGTDAYYFQRKCKDCGSVWVTMALARSAEPI